ncbi:hypothetical protein ACFU44_06595, partial [Nocardia rhizosphaerihabitans]|uniref:hypothetical protein n=1 Tax=Nocardia rhizosphaerihabitans TaxID=1691570 RepID=UPI003672AF5D
LHGAHPGERHDHPHAELLFLPVMSAEASSGHRHRAAGIEFGWAAGSFVRADCRGGSIRGRAAVTVTDDPQNPRYIVGLVVEAYWSAIY